MSKEKLTNGAIFYTQKNYAGSSYEYPENSTEVNLAGTPLNDKFFPLKLEQALSYSPGDIALTVSLGKFIVNGIQVNPISAIFKD
ncbi:beta/gamma crystallin domain-containing protein [Xenorhabdus sp. PR6a]|nr:beta/gamma crystallin domain-containing protein [Xenorhabdus sp. PR6a]MDC9582975.1 beta/gamma crystallin domain-containing protein [Xenorhabdus sp. PR6a]